MAGKPGLQAAGALLLLVFTHSALTDLVAGQGPAPSSAEAPSSDSSPPAPPGFPPGPVPGPAPATAPSAPSPNEEAPSPPPEPPVLRWCAVQEEKDNCTSLVSQLVPIDGAVWSCVQKDSKLDCMNAIKAGEADLVSLDAGKAYLAFVNYSMKAIAAEEYCYHQKVYDALMVVNKEMCDKNPKLSIKDFRGKKSCHAGYQFAGSWNYPVQFLLSSKLESIPSGMRPNDQTVVSSFFSASCAPSDDSNGICTACNTTTSPGARTCDSHSPYAGYSGAFRCLMEGLGDIAFLRSGIAQLFSSEGFLPQPWSKKPVTDFMYLCPSGGCRPINDDRSTCTLGSVAANAIMVPNNISLINRNNIQDTLTRNSRNWTGPLFSGTNAGDILLSASAEGLATLDELTREYLGLSANVSRIIQLLNSNQLQASDLEYASSECCGPVSVSWVLVLITFAFVHCWLQW